LAWRPCLRLCLLGGSPKKLIPDNTKTGDDRQAGFNIDDVIANDVKVRVEGEADASGDTRRDTELSPHYKRAFIRVAFSRH
jgi:hypothetical protein